MTINGNEFGRASVGTEDEIKQQQNVNVMGDGSIRARDAEPFGELITYKFARLTPDMWAALKATIRYVCSFSATPVVVVDDYGVSRTGNYWANSLKGRSRLGRFVEAEVTFRFGA